MAMDTANTVNTAYTTGRIDELQRENQELREQLRRVSVQQTVARNALQEAVGEKEAAAKLAHAVTVEERATRAAVEVQGNNIGLSVILQALNFFLLLITLICMFTWLPRTLEDRLKPGT